jgi:hypothetical protein
MAWIVTSDVRSKTSSVDPCLMDSVPAVHGTVMAASAPEAERSPMRRNGQQHRLGVDHDPHDIGQGRIGLWSGDHDDGLRRFDLDVGIKSELVNAEPEQTRLPETPLSTCETVVTETPARAATSPHQHSPVGWPHHASHAA